MQAYRAWCAQQGFTAIELSVFPDEIKIVSRKLGIEMAVTSACIA